MTPRELINIIRQDVGTAAPGRTQLLQIINRAQNEILAEVQQLMRIKPDPFFETVDETYSYTASDSLYDSSDGTQGDTQFDVRTIKEIYSFDSDVSIFDTQTLDPSSARPNQVEIQPTRDIVTARIDVDPSIKPNGSDCTVKWFEDNNPGATTTTWRAKAYKWPTQVESESTAFELPEEFQHTLLYWAAMRQIDRRERGRNDFSFNKYEFWLKKYRSKYNRQATQEIKVCYPRDF